MRGNESVEVFRPHADRPAAQPHDRELALLDQLADVLDVVAEPLRNVGEGEKVHESSLRARVAIQRKTRQCA